MQSVDEVQLSGFIETVLETFHKRRIDSLGEIKLKKILSRKNPYLFRAKNIRTAEELVKSFLDAHLSSQEESLFGTVLESLAIFIASKCFNGRKSSSPGIDLVLEREGIVYLVSIKSGPHWGNASQIAKMRDHFKQAKKIMGTNALKQNVVCVNGCCYGRTAKADQGDYLKLCGKDFWELISGSSTLYLEIIKPIGFKAKEKNEAFLSSYSEVINKFVREFTNEFCDSAGKILWDKIVRLSSCPS